MTASIYPIVFGEFKIYIISDGGFPVSRDFFIKNAKSNIENEYPESFLVPLNVVLIHKNGKNILVDAGLGRHLGSKAGHLKKHLNEIGILPTDIDYVIITHSHLDHIGGLIEGRSKVFPHATYLISEMEYSYLKEFGTHEEIEIVSTLGDNLKYIENEGTMVEGIHFLYYPGHTNGNLVVEIISGEQTLLVAGDIFNIPPSIEDSTIHIDREHSLNAAIASRNLLIKKSNSTNAVVQLYHFPFPGLGKIVQIENKFVWDSSDYKS